MLLLPSMAWAEGSDTSAFERYASQSPIVAAGMSFAFGFISALTPCVFPMVPITVAIFGATESPSRMRGAALSATFVLGIACLFTPLGIGAALSGKLMGSALSNPWVVGVLAIVFLALASSMFGAFEMALPSSLNNKLSSVGGVGFKGAFVLGLVMGLVAAPCTGPFMTGMVTWIATTKNVGLGAICMFSFALGLGILFFIAGTFAVNLPKGGAWMMGIKWASGVGLAYMAFAYIRDSSPAIAKKIILPSNVFGVGVGVLFLIGIALGTVHVLAERRKSPIAHLSKPTKLASIVPAVAGAFLFISWLNAPKEMAVDPNAPKIEWAQKEAEPTVLAKATADKKPVLVDFGATWCKACMELEEQTFPDARVRTEVSRFSALHVDATDDDDEAVKTLQKKYKVVGLPTLILLDSSGKEQARFNEFVPPDKFVEALKKVN
jgi:thiol:disulfide interchange protein DsbD